MAEASSTHVSLMAHQVEGVEFLIERKAGILAFEQGLGKTLVAIQGFVRLRAAGLVDVLLVLCPNSLKRNWLAEIARFAPGLDAAIAEGPPKVRRRMLSEAKAAVVIVSYETARTEITGILALLERRRAVLVLDESHAVKNRTSLTSTAAEHFAPRAEYRWLLSGTPMTNTPTDLYTQIGIVTDKNPLGSFAFFKATYGGSQPSNQAELDALASRVAPYLLRRTKDECLDLPEKTFVDVRIELPAWQRALYNEMRDTLVAEFRAMSGEAYRAFASTALTRLLRLSQLASNPALLFPTEARTPGKIEELDHVVEELVRSNRKMIIWSHYVGTIEKLIARYAGFGTVALYGAVDAAERQNVAARFQEDLETRILIGNPAAAGTGFTLTAAAYTIYETLSWRYDFYAQSQDRNHRIGQLLPVTYIRLIAADTIEEVMIGALERKSVLARWLLGDQGDEPRIADLSREQMCQLLEHPSAWA